MHVFAARVQRRGEDGALDLWGEVDGRVAQVVRRASCVVRRVSRGGGCRRARDMAAESSLRVAEGYGFGEWGLKNRKKGLIFRFAWATIFESDQGRA